MPLGLYRILAGLCLVQICLASHIGCKIMPQDPEWPDSSAWNHFNSSVDGRLIRTAPHRVSMSWIQLRPREVQCCMGSMAPLSIPVRHFLGVLASNSQAPL